jgi:hypothetical protein
MPARSPNPSHVLTPEHRDQLREWFVSGLTPNGVQAQMEQFNRESAARGLAPFPSLNLSTIRYHYRRMKNDVDRLIREEIAREQLSGRKGLRDRDERIKWLEYGAEKLVPHLGSANSRGEFTAADAFVKYMEQIRKETDPKLGEADALDPSFVRGLSTERIMKIISDRKAATGGTP